MADETTDASNKEQLIIAFRYVDNNDFSVEQTVCSRFRQPGYNTYKNLQELLFKAIKGEDFQPELQFVSQFYQDDIISTNLKVQLRHMIIQSKSTQLASYIFDIRYYMRNLTPAKK